MITIVQGLLLELCMELSGVFSTGATGAMAPVILRKRLIAPAVSNRNGKILLTLGTRNIKILNTLLHREKSAFNMPNRYNILSSCFK